MTGQHALPAQSGASIRNVLRYLKVFRNAVLIIHIEDSVLNTPLYLEHIRDICMLHEAGLKVILVPGARRRIDEILRRECMGWQIVNGYRITDEQAMPLIKMAAFDVSNRIMTSLAGEKKTAVIGNWIRAKGMGVSGGIDYATSGEIDKVNLDSLRSVLKEGCIPILPCIGWSLAGKPYNISSVQLAAEMAVCIGADKLFYMTEGCLNSQPDLIIPEGIYLLHDKYITAMTIEQTAALIAANEHRKQAGGTLLSIYKTAANACRRGVKRVHIVDSLRDGSILDELFSDFGSGTMIYESDYGKIRKMTSADIPKVLSLMRPFMEADILLARTEADLASSYKDYIIFELDRSIRACAALHFYSGGQAEIAAVAVDENCSHMGIGPRLIKALLEKARQSGAESVFVLTTKTADWFEQQGFSPDDIDTLPKKRRKKWSPQRKSKLLRITFNKGS